MRGGEGGEEERGKKLERGGGEERGGEGRGEKDRGE